MSRRILCLVAAAGVAANTLPLGASPEWKDRGWIGIRPELERLRGTWTLVTLEAHGRRQMGADDTRTFTFDGDKWALTKDGQVYSSGTVRLVRTAGNPRAFDLVSRSGDGEVVYTSIYSVEGDTLRYCTGPVRPTGFATKAGGGSMSSVWKRKKP